MFDIASEPYRRHGETWHVAAYTATPGKVVDKGSCWLHVFDAYQQMEPVTLTLLVGFVARDIRIDS